MCDQSCTFFFSPCSVVPGAILLSRGLRLSTSLDHRFERRGMDRIPLVDELSGACLPGDNYLVSKPPGRVKGLKICSSDSTASACLPDRTLPCGQDIPSRCGEPDSLQGLSYPQDCKPRTLCRQWEFKPRTCDPQDLARLDDSNRKCFFMLCRSAGS